jgi:hypothetical protein
MMRNKNDAPRRVAAALFTPLFIRIAGLLVLAAGVLASVPPASAVTAIGVHRPATTQFFLDGNLDQIGDSAQYFGDPADVGLLADITGSGLRSVVLFRNGVWYFDFNRDGIADMIISFGAPGDIPIVGDINGDGKDDIGVFRDGAWYFATNPACPLGVKVCGAPGSVAYFFGAAGDKPLLADPNGTGTKGLMIYRGGAWYFSAARDGVGTAAYGFGGVPGDIPMAFDFDGDGKDDLVIFRGGSWYVSTNRDGVGSAGFAFGAPGDKPLYAGVGAVANPRLDAARFLNQATFGPTPSEMVNVCGSPCTQSNYSAWIDNQFIMPVTALPAFGWLPDSQPNNCTSPLTAGGPADPFGTNCPRDLYSIYQLQRFFFVNTISAPDQLRQRVAWALSQILVTSSTQDPIAYANRDYQQMLIDNAFGNFRNILFSISVSPFMGNYLDMVNNAKATATKQPNENYAREIMQLFSIGTLELNPDGSLLLDLGGNPIQTYDQTDITELAKVMTGWTYWPQPGVATFSWNAPVNYQNTMAACEGAVSGCGATNYHETSIKTVLGYTIPPGLRADADLSTVVDVIFYHPNVAPFIGKQLIQHLVTSNPSPAYVGRVSAVFNDNGSGVRGDLKSVVKAILLDPEARAPRNPIGKFGKLKEPVTRISNFIRQMSVCCGAYTDGIDPATRSRAMGQDVYTSPTVFNYYPADYIIPGTNLAGPQYGIFDPTSLFESTKTFYNWTIGATCGAAPNTNICGPNPDATTVGSLGTKIDWTSLAAVAGTTTTLVDTVSDILLYSPLPPGPRQQVINAVNAVPVNTPPTAAQLRDRARTAVYMIAISPKYQVEY